MLQSSRLTFSPTVPKFLFKCLDVKVSHFKMKVLFLYLVIIIYSFKLKSNSMFLWTWLGPSVELGSTWCNKTGDGKENRHSTVWLVAYEITVWAKLRVFMFSLSLCFYFDLFTTASSIADTVDVNCIFPSKHINLSGCHGYVSGLGRADAQQGLALEQKRPWEAQ